MSLIQFEFNLRLRNGAFFSKQLLWHRLLFLFPSFLPFSLFWFFTLKIDMLWSWNMLELKRLSYRNSFVKKFSIPHFNSFFVTTLIVRYYFSLSAFSSQLIFVIDIIRTFVVVTIELLLFCSRYLIVTLLRVTISKIFLLLVLF